VQASIRDVLEQAPWLPKASVPTVSLENQQESEVQEVSMSFQDETFLRSQFQKKEFFPSPSPRSAATVSSISEQKEVPSKRYWANLQILGQAHLTYLVCQDEKGIMIIDQHAAHERVMFEKLMGAYQGEKIEIQDFLFPLVVDLSPEQTEAIEQNKATLQKFGISFELLGPNSVGISSAPVLMKDQAIHPAIVQFAQEIIDQGGSYRIEKAISNICATMACHSAIRAGQSLSQEEIKSLLTQMDEYPLSSFCPHGRTVSVHYPLYELEKDFGRIV